MYFNLLMHFSWLDIQMTSDLFCFYKAMSCWTLSLINLTIFYTVPQVTFLRHRCDPMTPYSLKKNKPTTTTKNNTFLTQNRRPFLTWPFITSLSSSATSSLVLSPHHHLGLPKHTLLSYMSMPSHILFPLPR